MAIKHQKAVPPPNFNGRKPSWSWAGWCGELTPTWRTCPLEKTYGPLLLKCRLPKPQFPNSRTIPFLQWFLQISVEARRQPILFQNDWYDYKVRYFGGGDDSLPEGWSTVDEKGFYIPYLWQQECEKVGLDISIHEFRTPYRYIFHAYYSEHRFCHPIPVGEELESAPGGFDVEPPSGRYLCAETTQLRLKAFKAPENSVKDTSDEDVNEQMVKEAAKSKGQDGHFTFNICGYSVSGCSVILCDDLGEPVGVLFPNLAEDIQEIWDSGRQGIEVDVVAVSRGHTICFPQVHHPEKWNFYHVLWVEWIDGIAYRKGVGQVFRSAWEGMGAEDVYLILG